MKYKLYMLNDKSNLQSTSPNKSINKSKGSAYKDKNHSNSNNQNSQEKKSLSNIATIYQMNNMKKDFKNIFNNELTSTQTFNKKSDSCEFIIPLNNSIDEKIGLDKIEFIDQRDFFANLNNNNLEILNKKTTADHTIVSNSHTNHLSLFPEKTEKIGLDVIMCNNSNEDLVNMKSNKKCNLDLKENNSIDCLNNQIVYNNKNNLLDLNNLNNLSSYEKQFNEEEFVKVKNCKPAAYSLKLNSRINNEKNTSAIIDSIGIENATNKLKSQLSGKILNVSCDYEENVFEEKTANVIVIERTGADKFAALSRNNSKRDVDSSFIKNRNNLSLKKHFRVNSCDATFLINRINNSTKEEGNINKNNNKDLLLLNNKFPLDQDKCDMETHHNEFANDCETNNNNNSKKTHKKAYSEIESNIPSYSYYHMKNSYKNIENYATPNLNNTFIKHKQQTQENMEKETLSKFLLNTYLSNLTQEKYEKDLLSFSNIQKNVLLNSNNNYNHNYHYHPSSNNNNQEENLNLNNYLSIKEKLEEIRFSNFNNNNISPTKNKSISSNHFCNPVYENFQNDSLETMRNSNSNFLQNKKFTVPKTYGTIHSQTESENKTIENHNGVEAHRNPKASFGDDAYAKKKECVCSNNLNPNKSVKFECLEKDNCSNKPEKSEINVCPECEVHQIPKGDLFEANDSKKPESKLSNNFNPINNNNHYHFSTSLKNNCNTKPRTNNNNLSNIAQNFSSNVNYNFNNNNNNFNSNANNLLRNTSNENNTNNFFSQLQTNFLNTNMSNPYTNLNNFLYTRSYSNNLAQNNNNLMTIDNSNLLSEAQLFRQSRSLNNKDDCNNLFLNRLSVNSAKATNANEENLSMEKGKNTSANLNNQKTFKHCTFSTTPWNPSNTIKNDETDPNYNSHKAPFASSNSKVYNNNDNSNSNNFLNFNSNKNPNSNYNTDEIKPNLNVSEFNSLNNKDYKSARVSAENKIFYSCSPPSSIKKQRSNLQNESKFFSLKQQKQAPMSNTNNNSHLNKTSSLEEFRFYNDSGINEVKKTLKLFDLTKECILLKNGKTNAELLNTEYQSEMKIKNMQLGKLKKSLIQSKLKSELDKGEIKRLQMTVGILNSKIKNLENEHQGKPNTQKSFRSNASYLNFNSNNISYYLSTSVNKSCLVNKDEIEIKKSIKLINKNVLKPKFMRSHRETKDC